MLVDPNQVLMKAVGGKWKSYKENLPSIVLCFTTYEDEEVIQS